MSTVMVQEGDGHQVRVDWKDGNGIAFTPTTVRYRVDCVTSSTTPLSWQSLSPAASVLIDIPGTVNQIINDANPSEVRQVTVQANHGQPNQRTVVGEYVVPNNAFLT
jgi:hypothetical protein